MIPKFHIPKITRKLSLDMNIRRLRAISNRLGQTETKRDPMSQDDNRKTHYMYLFLQGDIGSVYDDAGEIDPSTVNNILDFWFQYKPDVNHDPESEKKEDLNSQGIHMAAKKREKPLSWDYVISNDQEFVRNKDGDYLKEDGDDIFLGWVIELSEKLPTPYEEVLQETNNKHTANRYGKIHTSVTGRYDAIENGQSYLYVDRGSWVKIIYLGTDQDRDWYKQLLIWAEQDLEEMKRKGVLI